MKSVGVKVLKAKLSEYLRLVKTGETVLVTERDDVIAELRPARRQKVSLGSLDDQLQLLADRGEATLRTKHPRRWSGPKAYIRIPEFSSQALLDKLRKESH